MSDQRSPNQRPTRMAGGGMQIGRVLGVPVVVQPFWFVIVLFIAVTFGPEVQRRVPSLSDAASYLVALVFAVFLYGAVLVHEMGHVAVAQALGMEVRRVVLQPLGGVSEVVEERPGKPAREYLVAAVGPLTSVLLGAGGLVLANVLTEATVPWVIAYEFAYANLFLAAFNALPGLPLDGGRVLRAALWQITRDKARGTLAAGWTGRGLAVGLVFVAVARPWGESTAGAIYLLLIAAFMWTNATVAIAQAKVTGVLPKLDIRSMTRRAMPVAAELPVAEAVRRARDAGARALVVVDSLGKPSGLVSEAAVTALSPQRQPWVAISDLARPVDDTLVLRTDMNGEALLQAVQEAPATEYLVVDNVGAVCGVLARIDLVAALQAAGLR